jgi:hypothetical protein
MWSVGTALPVPQQELRPVGIGLGAQLDRRLEEPSGSRQRVQRQGSIAGLRQPVTGLPAKFTRVLARRGRELEGADVVVGEHLRQVLDAVRREVPEPSGHCQVLRRPVAPRHLSVRDVAD